MRKLLAVFIVFLMLMVQLPAGLVSADSADARAALEQLNNLSDEDKSLLLKNMWDYVVEKIGDGRPTDVQAIYDEIKTNLTDIGVWEDIVDESGSVPGDGKIAGSSVRTMIQKLLNNSEIIVDYYNMYSDTLTKEWVKEFLGLPPDATKGEVYAALLPYTVGILTTDGNRFVRYGDVSEKMADKLGISQSLFSVFLEDVNGKIDDLAGRINNNMAAHGLSKEDVIYALEIYDLYADPDSTPPTVNSTTPGNNATNVPLNQTITVTFSENILKGGEGEANFNGITLKAGNNTVTVDKSISGKKLVLVPSGNLSYSTAYTVTIPAGSIEDYAGNLLAASYTFTFTTVAEGGGGGGGGGIGGGEEEEAITEEEAKEELDNIGNELDNISDALSEADTPEEKAALAEKVADKLKDAAGLIDNISDPGEALKIGVKLIGSMGGVLANLSDTPDAFEKIADALLKLADKIMEKVGTAKIESVVSGNTASASLDESKVNELIRKLDSIIAAAEQLNNSLSGSGAGIDVEAVLYLKFTLTSGGSSGALPVQQILLASTGSPGKILYDSAIYSVAANAASTGEINKSIVELPVRLFKAASEKKLDKIAVETAVSTIALAPDALDIPASGSIVIQSEKLDSSKLADEIKAAAGNDAVYDFSVKAGSDMVEKFNKPARITVSYKPKTGSAPKKVTVFFISDEGRLENIIGNYDQESKSVTFTTVRPGKYLVKVNNVTFNDIDTVKWAKEYIEVMASKGVIKGIGEGRFNPHANLTRAEFAAMIVRALQLVDTTASSSFSDVKEGDWFYEYVSSAVKAGIVTGRPDGTFAPEEKVSRQDMAVMLANALVKVKGKSVPADTEKCLAKFTDSSSVSGYAKSSASLVARYSIMGGKPGGVFAPSDFSTRAEAATVIYRLFYLK